MEIIENRVNSLKDRKGLLGINIGPNKNSKNPIEDFQIVSKKLSKYFDYLTKNISSPNTPGLRQFHQKMSSEISSPFSYSRANDSINKVN